MLHLKNATVLTMAEDRPLENCDIKLDGGKIIAVGPRLPEEGEILDLTGKYVLPGFVDAHTHVGGIAMDGSLGEDLNEMSSPVTAELSSYYGINPNDPAFPHLLRHGITTNHVAPGSANVVGGWTVVLKSAGKDLHSRVLRHPAALKAAVGINPKGVYAPKFQAPMTRMSIAETLREYLRKVREYMEKQAKAEGDPAKMPPYDEAMEHGIPVLRKEIPLKVHSYQHDMLTVLSIAEEFDIFVTLDHAQGATDFLAEISGSRHVQGVIYGPICMGIFPGEGCKIDFDTLPRLDALGVPVCMMTDGPVTNAQILLTQVGEAVREGMDPIRALRTITVNPAKVIGCSDRVGSLEPGKDADVLVFDALPTLDPRARLLMTFIDGQKVWQA